MFSREQTVLFWVKRSLHLNNLMLSSAVISPMGIRRENWKRHNDHAILAPMSSGDDMMGDIATVSKTFQDSGWHRSVEGDTRVAKQRRIKRTRAPRVLVRVSSLSSAIRP